MYHVFSEIQKTDKPYPIHCSDGKILYAIYEKSISSKIFSYMKIYKKENFGLDDFHYEITFKNSEPIRLISRENNMSQIVILEPAPRDFLPKFFPLIQRY